MTPDPPVEALAAVAGLRIEPERVEAVRRELGGMLRTLAVLDSVPLTDELPDEFDAGWERA